MRPRNRHTYAPQLPAKRQSFLNGLTLYKFKRYLSAIQDLPDAELTYLIENSENPAFAPPRWLMNECDYFINNELFSNATFIK